MEKNLLIQYTIVGIFVAVACVWIIVKAIKIVRGKTSPCSGCVATNSCSLKELKRRNQGVCRATGNDTCHCREHIEGGVIADKVTHECHCRERKPE